ncbi:hypothetical protein VKI21_06740 [Cyanobacterium aponinum UTEX 3222]|uniref:hypothetical protein n=1 Tax=Cyanobacterium aponinum TaxID=379064 RepID=UPI002B4C066A|nr:hypothetical protein [Cyanobacterium aponinum]WRL38814.1 hypothetical protein VKI22_01580 [Cyanobacterium aponinum UTEX 3221]WRL43373.1 hypothetical protein VKI21_06740 [Cyanobacterium aponinum UTEX 3222]
MIIYNPIVLNSFMIDAEEIVWIEIDTANTILVSLKNKECIKLVGEDAGRLILIIQCLADIEDLPPQFASFLEYLPKPEKPEKPKNNTDSVPF